MGINGHSEVNGLTGSARPRHPRQPGDERELDTLLFGDVRAMAEDDMITAIVLGGIYGLRLECSGK